MRIDRRSKDIEESSSKFHPMQMTQRLIIVNLSRYFKNSRETLFVFECASEQAIIDILLRSVH